MRVFIITPAYDHKVSTHYAYAVMRLVMALKQRGDDIQLSIMMGTGNVPRARNFAVAQGLARGYDRFLFLDSDIGFAPDDVLSLLDEPAPVIGAAQVGKHGGFGFEPLDRGPIQQKVMEVRYIGTACLKVDRVVFEALIEAYPHLKFETTDDTVAEDEQPFLYEFFAYRRPEGEPRRVLGEDYGFCELFNQMGGCCHLRSDIALLHEGRSTLTGKPEDEID